MCQIIVDLKQKDDSRNKCNIILHFKRLYFIALYVYPFLG